jgi:DNA-binding NarL/FixJ family response regulator
MMATNGTSIIKVSVYDDSWALRESLSKLFAAFHQFQLLGAYPNAITILENCKYQKPDVILMDIDMPGVSGIEAVTIVKENFPAIKVLMLTVFDDNHRIFQSICNGAVGYILKKEEPIKIMEAVQQAYEGGAPMSPTIAVKILYMFRHHNHTQKEEIDLSARELQILSLLSKGFSYKMIAAESEICIDTVRFHIKKIYEKLQVHSMTEAVSKAIKNNWV